MKHISHTTTLDNGKEFSGHKQIAKFTDLTKEMDPSMTYIRGEALDFSLNPLSLLTGYNPLKLTWGNTKQTYQTTCEINSDFTGQTGIVNCAIPQTLPPMLPKK
ncbi:MAG: hypothetical protein EXR81_02375 [Gammaproteobacteria bacterium]|nr:hypothetical protein [Gammaproteobacteria bacterium]